MGALGPRSETMLPKCGASRASASPWVVLNCQGASLQLWGRGWEQPATGEWPRVQWAAGGVGVEDKAALEINFAFYEIIFSRFLKQTYPQ